MVLAPVTRTCLRFVAAQKADALFFNKDHARGFHKWFNHCKEYMVIINLLRKHMNIIESDNQEVSKFEKVSYRSMEQLFREYEKSEIPKFGFHNFTSYIAPNGSIMCTIYIYIRV